MDRMAGCANVGARIIFRLSLGWLFPYGGRWRVHLGLLLAQPPDKHGGTNDQDHCRRYSSVSIHELSLSCTGGGKAKVEPKVGSKDKATSASGRGQGEGKGLENTQHPHPALYRAPASPRGRAEASSPSSFSSSSPFSSLSRWR